MGWGEREDWKEVTGRGTVPMVIVSLRLLGYGLGRVECRKAVMGKVGVKSSRYVLDYIM